MTEEFKYGDSVVVEVRDLPPLMFPFNDFWYPGTFIERRGKFADVKLTKDESEPEGWDKIRQVPMASVRAAPKSSE